MPYEPPCKKHKSIPRIPSNDEPWVDSQWIHNVRDNSYCGSVQEFMDRQDALALSPEEIIPPTMPLNFHFRDEAEEVPSPKRRKLETDIMQSEIRKLKHGWDSAENEVRALRLECNALRSRISQLENNQKITDLTFTEKLHDADKEIQCLTRMLGVEITRNKNLKSKQPGTLLDLTNE